MTDPDNHTPAPDASRAPTELALEKAPNTIAEGSQAHGSGKQGSAAQSSGAQSSGAQGSGAQGSGKQSAEPKTLAESGAKEKPTTNSSIQLRRVTLTSPDAGEAEVPAPASPEAYVGFIIDGRYHIQELLAQGGMGVVYRARHRIIDKAVALKVLRPELVHNREITQRFLTEAQAASAIGSEHIVDITDYGELPDGATYIVMEFLDGISLADLIERPEPISTEQLLSIARQLAEGLQRAHDAHIIHRDLKPDNVLLISRAGNDSFVKILDFGIAKVASSQNQITRAGKVFGTPHYMSPEQAAGTPQDQRTDIYSLGVILYQMLSRQLPFDGENPLGILTQHMYVEPPPLGDVCAVPISPGLEAVITKCLSKKPEERYPSMLELDEDLERLQQFKPPLALFELQKRDSLPRTLRRRLRKATSRAWKPVAWLLGVVGVAIAAVTGASQLELDELLSLAGRATSATAQPEPPAYNEVALVLAPHDAHVYSNGKDLGMMPINVRLRIGQTQKLEVRREGYSSKRITIDGSETRIVVQLVALPGAETPPLHPPRDAGRRVRTIMFEGDAGTPREITAHRRKVRHNPAQSPPGPPVVEDDEEESFELTLPAPPPWPAVTETPNKSETDTGEPTPAPDTETTPEAEDSPETQSTTEGQSTAEAPSPAEPPPSPSASASSDRSSSETNSEPQSPPESKPSEDPASPEKSKTETDPPSGAPIPGPPPE